MYREVFAAALVLLATIPGSLAQSTVSVHFATVPQAAPMTAAEQKNLDLVLNWWREVIEAHHTELASKYQAEDYIQHNPNVPTGRAAFVRFFSSLGPAINPIPDKLSGPPVVKGAKGNFVWLVFEYESKDPNDASKTIYCNSFDVLRIQNHKIQEHWDSARKSPGSPAFVPSTAPSPSTWITSSPTEDEHHMLALATRLEKDVLEYGRVELIDTILAPEFIEHNPNIPSSRDGLKQFLIRRPDHAPQEIKPEWKRVPALALSNGPYVVMMWDRIDKDPSDPTRAYTRNYFAVLRIENDLIQDDWN